MQYDVEGEMEMERLQRRALKRKKRKKATMQDVSLSTVAGVSVLTTVPP